MVSDLELIMDIFYNECVMRSSYIQKFIDISIQDKELTELGYASLSYGKSEDIIKWYSVQYGFPKEIDLNLPVFLISIDWFYIYPERRHKHIARKGFELILSRFSHISKASILYPESSSLFGDKTDNCLSQSDLEAFYESMGYRKYQQTQVMIRF